MAKNTIMCNMIHFECFVMLLFFAACFDHRICIALSRVQLFSFWGAVTKKRAEMTTTKKNETKNKHIFIFLVAFVLFHCDFFLSSGVCYVEVCSVWVDECEHMCVCVSVCWHRDDNMHSSTFRESIFFAMIQNAQRNAQNSEISLWLSLGWCGR